LSDDGHDNQTNFSEWWKSQFKQVRLPTRDTVFDYWLDPISNKFEPWRQNPSFHAVDFDSRTAKMNEVTVPTTETASICHWTNLLVQCQQPVLLAGPSGTGKTQLVTGTLRELPPTEYLSVGINMNYYSTATILISSLEGPLQKRTGSTYGAPGSARLIYFIDDLNLPQLDKYNTQSAIALMRQHLDYAGWYDPVKLTLKSVIDCQYMACMNPTAGSFLVNPRLQRHFSTFAVGMPSATSLLTIFQTFLDGHFQAERFSANVCNQGSNIIKGALALHKEMHDTFRKTVSNFHYECHPCVVTLVLMSLHTLFVCSLQV
jgi:dynein heavy chain